MAAIAQAYFTVVEFRAAINKGSPDDDLVLARQAVAVSRFIDRQTGQFFGKDSAAVIRYWVGDGSYCLRLTGDEDDDLCPGIADTTGMAVALDSAMAGTYSTTLSAGQYEAWPLNADKGPEPRPYRELVIPSWTTGSFGFWPAGMRVRVTAIYGWPSVPEPIWADSMELCGIWRGENPRSTGNMNELEAVVSTSPMAMSLVKRIQRAYSRAVVG